MRPDVDRLGNVYGPKGLRHPAIQRGYKVVLVRENGGFKNYKVHRLVAEKYIPNPENLPCINHINGDKLDNRVENLEWCTQKHNIQEAFRLELCSNQTPVICIETGERFVSATEAGRAYNIERRNITSVCQHKRHTAGGYHWRYDDEY